MFWTVVAAATVGPSAKQDANECSAVVAHLCERYPVTTEFTVPQLQFEHDSALLRLDTPAISKAAPALRFYRTELTTGAFEYWKVQTIVAVWNAEGRMESAEGLSPLYDDLSAAFLHCLKGLKGKTVEDRQRLSEEICELFALITRRGRIVGGQFTENQYRAELWHGDLLWRRIHVKFDAAGSITDVALVNTKSERDE